MLIEKTHAMCAELVDHGVLDEPGDVEHTCLHLRSPPRPTTRYHASCYVLVSPEHTRALALGHGDLTALARVAQGQRHPRNGVDHLVEPHGALPERGQERALARTKVGLGKQDIRDRRVASACVVESKPQLFDVLRYLREVPR